MKKSKNPLEVMKLFGKGNKEISWKYKWNYLMRAYGWIPKEEFLELDAQDVEDLIQIIVDTNPKGGKK